jgi:hypothetical protein
MSVKRGLDRIALVLALMALIPGGVIGWYAYDIKKTEKIRVEKPSSPKSEKPTTEEMVDDVLLGKVPPKKPTAEKPSNGRMSAEAFLSEGLGPLFEYKYQHPPKWQCAIAGIFGAGIAFLFVLFAVGGTTRVILWVVGGFSGQKNK